MTEMSKSQRPWLLDQQTDCQFARAIAGTPPTPPADSSNAASSINVTVGQSAWLSLDELQEALEP